MEMLKGKEVEVRNGAPLMLVMGSCYSRRKCKVHKSTRHNQSVPF